MSGAALHDLMTSGRQARQRGDRPAAATAFAAAIALQPHHVWARLELAAELLHGARLDEAEALLRTILLEQPAIAAPHLRLADLSRRRGDFAATLQACEAAVAADPAHLHARLALAQELADQGRTGAAVAELEAILAADPTEAPAWLRLGLVRRLGGERAAALDAFRRAAALCPAAAQPLVEAAIEERALGRPDRSEAALRNALALEPGNLPAILQMAEHAMLAERPAEALARCEDALARQPDSLPALHGAARATALLEGRDAAVRRLKQAPPALRDRPELLVLRLDLLRQAGRTDAMRALLLGVADRLRTHVPLWLQAVRLDLALGDFAAVRAALADPPPASAREQAGIELVRAGLAEATGDLDGAAAACGEALRVQPESPGPHQELARLQLRRLDLDAAALHLRAWVRLGASAKRLRGETLNSSQTRIGQVLDEFRLDGAVLATLIALRDQPAAARLAPLLRLVRDNPDHTPAAIGLLATLREAGLLDAPPQPARQTIPPRIAQYWADPSPPPDLPPLLRSWQDHHPGHTWRLYDDAAAVSFLAGRCGTDILAAYRRAALPAQKADIFRLAWLFLEGGIWADADDRCHAPLPDMLPLGTTFAGHVEEFGAIGNNLLAAVPGHPVIGRALTLAAASVNRGDADVLWLATGPGLLTRAFALTLAESAAPLSTVLEGCVLLDRCRLGRTVAMHCALDYKQGRRHRVRSGFGRQGPRSWCGRCRRRVDQATAPRARGAIEFVKE